MIQSDMGSKIGVKFL